MQALKKRTVLAFPFYKAFVLEKMKKNLSVLTASPLKNKSLFYKEKKPTDFVFASVVC